MLKSCLRRPARLGAIVALTALLLPACSSGTEPGAELLETRTLQIEGEARRYILLVPEGVEPRGAPLMMVFHGAGGTGEGMREGSDVERVAAEVGAVLVFPDAGHFNWAEDCGCVAADRVHGSADTAFVSAILSDAASAVGTAPTGFYAVGFSQGGMFAQRLGCQMTDRLRGVAVVAATMSVQLSEQCAPSQPVDFFLAVSLQDPIFPWFGSGGNFATLPTLRVGGLWREWNGCDEDYVRTEEEGVIRYTSTGCPPSGRVLLLGVNPGAHAWYMSALVDTSAELAAFFRS